MRDSGKRYRSLATAQYWELMYFTVTKVTTNRAMGYADKGAKNTIIFTYDGFYAILYRTGRNNIKRTFCIGP
jgi:hypothetical protein